MQVALKDIKENKWEILSVEEKFREVTEKDYSEDQSGFEYYQQATIDGECYVYHRWPREPQDEDAVH